METLTRVRDLLAFLDYYRAVMPDAEAPPLNDGWFEMGKHKEIWFVLHARSSWIKPYAQIVDILARTDTPSMGTVVEHLHAPVYTTQEGHDGRLKLRPLKQQEFEPLLAELGVGVLTTPEDTIDLMGAREPRKIR